MSAFERFDRSMSSFITSYDIVRFLNDNSVYSVSEPEAFNLVKYFDADNKGCLNFADFIQIFLTCEDQMSREVTLARKPLYRISKFQSLHPTIERNMADIIVKEVQYASRVESLKREVISCYYFSPTAAFRTIDLNNLGFITPMALDSFFMRNTYPATTQQVDAVIRRIDYQGDSRISYTELDEFLRPIYPDLTRVKTIIAPTIYTAPLVTYEPYRPFVSRYASPVRTTTTRFDSPLGNTVKTVTTEEVSPLYRSYGSYGRSLSPKKETTTYYGRYGGNSTITRYYD